MKARGALEIMRNNQFLGEVNPVMVTRDRDGKMAVQLQRQLPRQSPAHHPVPCSQMPVLLTDVIFGKPPVERQ